MILVFTAFILVYWLTAGIYGRRVVLRVSTTTSLYDTGLLEALAKEFTEKRPHVVVQFIPVGSGRALRLAADGSVCLVMVHAPNLEKVYLEKGVIYNHVIFAYNYFVVVGPREDPASVRSAASIVDAFRRIAEAGHEGRALFVSRGDCSGTYVRERLLWMKAGLDPRPYRDRWYIEVGSGMSATLRIANERGAYTLSDIGTFAKLSENGAVPRLSILYPSSPDTADILLLNVYSAYLVKGCKGDELQAAIDFLRFLKSPDAQELIANYRVGNVTLFMPADRASFNLTRAWLLLSLQPTPNECR